MLNYHNLERDPLQGATLPQIHDPKDIEPHWMPGQTNEAYHGDKTAVSSTGLKKILKSPASFYQYHVLGETEEPTDAMKFGSAFHMYLLEPAEFKRNYLRVPRFVGKTKEGKDSENCAESRAMKEAWYKALPSTAVAMTDEEMDKLEGMLKALKRHKEAVNILKHGIPEVSGYYVDPETGILCKIRPDFYHVSVKLRALLDLKTAADCTKRRFQSVIYDRKYHLSLAMYCEGIKIITGEDVQYPVLLAIEKLAPYEIAGYVADKEMMAKGSEDYHHCLRTLKHCMTTNLWPGYQSKFEDIGLPSWALTEYE